jgi:uncharacterized phage-associated protein
MKNRVVDIAEYMLTQLGEMTAMKLHKLVYYSQAWHLVWDGVPLFGDEIQAWANGPVIPALYELHKGVYIISPGFFHEKLRAAQHATTNEEQVHDVRR